MTTLLDLYHSASAAAAKLLNEKNAIAVAKAKLAAFEESGAHLEHDADIWCKYFDEQLSRFQTLQQTAAPSAAIASAQPSQASGS